jgi:hypothetical protein
MGMWDWFVGQEPTRSDPPVPWVKAHVHMPGTAVDTSTTYNWDESRQKYYTITTYRCAECGEHFLKRAWEE